MKLSLALKQTFGVLGLIMLTVISTHFFYGWIRSDWIYYKTAKTYYGRQDWAQAREYFEKSFAQGLSYPEAHLDLAHTYIELKDFQLAKQEYKTYLEIRPHDATALRKYAATLIAVGEFDEAKQNYEKYFEIKKTLEH